MAANPYTNFVVISTDFSSSSIGSASVDASGALPSVPLVRIPMQRGSLFHASGIAYAFTYDASGAATGFTATVSNVTPSAIVQSHVDARVGGAFNAWANGSAAGNMLDVSFNFKGKWTRMKYDVLNASGLLGTSTIGQHVALMATNALLQRKPASTVDALSSATVSTLAGSINTAIGTRIGQVLASQAVQDAILKALVAANGPILDPSGNRAPYDASYSALDLILYLQNFACSITFPGQAAQTLTFDRLPIQISIA